MFSLVLTGSVYSSRYDSTRSLSASINHVHTLQLISSCTFLLLQSLQMINCKVFILLGTARIVLNLQPGIRLEIITAWSHKRVGKRI